MKSPSVLAVQSDPHAEFQDSFQALQRDPANPKVIWRFVRAAKVIGDYEAAIGVLEPILLIDADQQIIRSEIGLLYYKLGSYAAAEEHLSKALSSGKLSKKRARIVERVLGEVEDQNDRNRFVAAVTLGTRYQSNPTAASNDTLATFAGEDLALDDQIVRDDDGNVFLSGWFQHKYDFDLQNEASFDTRGALYATRQFEAHETNLLTATLEPGFSFKPFRHSARWLSVRPHILGNVLWLEDNLYSTSYGAGANLSFAYANNIHADITYQYRRRDYSNSSERPDAEDRNGHEDHYRARLILPLPESFAIRLKLNAIETDAKADRLDSWSYTLSGKLMKNYRAPMGLGDTNWHAWIRLDRMFRDFDGLDPTLSLSERRKDRRWIFAAGNTANIVENLDLNLEYATYDQSSNFKQYEYINHTGTISFSYSF